MGINFILPLIAGIVMTVILGTQVAPSLVENMKIAKVENRTISNQNLIKDAIVRYIEINGEIPVLENGDLDELMRAHHKENLFDGRYTFTIDKKKGVLTIFTKISDVGAGKYFSNSFKSPNKPTCKQALDINGVCVSGEFETFYLLDEETFNSISTPEIGSIRDIKARFTEDNIGKKKDKDGEEVVFVDGDKDYVVDIPNNQVTEYVYDEVNGWEKGTTIENIGGFGTETKVFISDLEWSFNDGLGNEIKQKHEKVHCKDTTLSDTEVFVVNENTGLGEVIWVAPNDALLIKNKIFNTELEDLWTDIYTDAIYKPNNICTSKVTDMEDLFYVAYNFNQPLNRWDTSNVIKMGSMFSNSDFNQALNNWDVSNVTDMIAMFSVATSFNKDISSWNVSKVTRMYNMFFGAKDFNQALNSWNVSSVTSMWGMFSGATIFNQDISNWNVSKVTDMREMFSNATSFNQDISNWNVGNVEYIYYMFSGATSFNQDISDWDVSNFTNMGGMFQNATSFNQDISDWQVGNVIDMSYMFQNATSFNQDISNWQVGNVRYMSSMFSGATNFNSGDNAGESNRPLNWNVSKVRNMSSMFSGATSFNQDISNWQVGKVTRMEGMFNGATSFNQPLDKWDTSIVTNMSEMFSNATSFNQDISDWNLFYVIHMDDMFREAKAFNQDLSGLCVKRITTKPTNFDTGSPLALTPTFQPKWNCTTP